MKAQFSLFLVLLFLEACVAPPQDFNPGSELWSRANPSPFSSEFTVENMLINEARHEVVVAVLDAGIDLLQPDLRPHLRRELGWDFLGKDAFPHYLVLDPQSGEDLSEFMGIQEHGTHVAKLTTLNNPKIGLLAIRVLPLVASERDFMDSMLEFKKDLLTRSLAQIEEAIDYSASRGAAIINMSIGLNLEEIPEPEYQSVLEATLKSVTAKSQQGWERSLLVAAAGNERTELKRVTQSVPATLPILNLISVGALKDRKTIASYSNTGKWVDVYVRGSDVTSAIPGGRRGKLSGTSMAAPLVSHLAAQVAIALPNLKGREIRALILNTSDVHTLSIEPEPVNEAKNLAVTVPLQVRVLNMAKTKRVISSWNSISRSEQNRFLRAPFEHGAAPL